MEKKYIKNKAGNGPTHNTVIMIVSILAISLFIGMAVQPVIADAVKNKNESHDLNSQNELKGDCKTCACMVDFTIRYMIKHVKDNLKGIYYLWTVDAVQLIFQGTMKGIANSGFNPQVNTVHLKASIYYWVNKLVGQQIFTTTKLLAVLSAIGVGISGYLLSLCNNPTTQTTICLKCKNVENIGIGNGRIINWIIFRYLYT
jgi:hypothetical protein